jgi:hypothetical protein
VLVVLVEYSAEAAGEFVCAEDFSGTKEA